MNTPTSTHPWMAYLFLMLSQIMVGISIVGTKFLIATTPIFFLLTIRFFFATILLLPLHWILDKDKKPLSYHFSKLNKRDWFIIAGQAMCAGVLFNIFMLSGLRYTDANVAGIITSSLPAIIAIMSWLILKEQLTVKKILCVGLATLGLLIISLNNLLISELEHSAIGNMLVFLALLPEATYYVLTKLKFTRLPLFLMSALINSMNVIILMPLMLISTDLSITLPLYSWLVIVLIGLTAGLFYVFWFLGAEKVDAVMGSLSTAVLPISTVVLAWLVLGESITWLQFAGMLLVIGSIVIYARSQYSNILPTQ